MSPTGHHDLPSEIDAVIRDGVQAIAVRIEVLKMALEKSRAGGAFKALGFESWTDYVTDIVDQVTMHGSNTLVDEVAVLRPVLLGLP